MMKSFFILMTIIMLVSTSAWAGGVPALKEQPYLNGKNPQLNAKEWQATKLARKWINHKDTSVMGENGKLTYLFGETMPSIISSPLQITDIELQPGEIVKDIHVGDAVRWKVSPAKSGPEGFETTHLIIKSTDVGLISTMVVLTDRRTYYFKLISRKKDWIPRISFDYPEDIKAQWAAYYVGQNTTRKKNTIPETGESVDNLNFDYEISGKAPWKPLRVYNNGVKTVIQMPHEMMVTEAPTLLVLGTGNREQLVNYRLHNDRYIVDKLFSKAILVAGVGKDQTRITIVRKEQVNK